MKGDANMKPIFKEEYKRFNCHRYKVLTYITYGYDKNNNIIYAHCSLQDDKNCNGYESPERKCPYRYPIDLKDEI